MEPGRRIFAFAATALGIIGLTFGAFAFFWQPVPPDLPGYTALAYIAGLLLLAGGVSAQFDRTARAGGIALAVAFAGFSIPWAIRVVRFPQMFGTWGGFAEELALVLAAVIVAGIGRAPEDGNGRDFERLAIIAFGACAVAFGFNHFTALPQTAGMVPKWIPPSGMFWAIATGFFHVAAGVAIVTGVKAELGARLLGCMMLVFGALIWLPNLANSPTAHMTWAGNFVNLALAGSSFVIADALRRRRRLLDASDR
jgi:uncharacterized membrane protein YphA (DoxX/SURF4 family)